MISRLHIENFRSIKNLTVDLTALTALVGPNNSGKSNILVALKRLFAGSWLSANYFTEDDVWMHDPELDIVFEITFDPPLSYTKYKAATPVDIPKLRYEWTRYKIGVRSGERRLEASCLDERDRQLNVLAKAPRRGEKHTYEPLVGIPNEIRDQVPLIYIGTNRELKDQLPSAKYSLLKQLLEDVEKGLRDPANVVEVIVEGKKTIVPCVEQFQQILSEAFALLRTDDFNDLEATIGENVLLQLGLDPDADRDKLDLIFTPFEPMDFYKTLDLKVKEGTAVFSATEMGQGVQNAIVIGIMKAFQERRKAGAIIVIEEPEMYLHPHKQRYFFGLLNDISKNNQVIYATHSPAFVSVPDYEKVRLIRQTPDGTEAIKTTLPPKEAEKDKLRKELDPERNELFFANRVMIVEGDTEKLAFPEFAKKLGFDLDREDATIIEVGGKRNLTLFAGITAAFGIPTAIVYDRDSSDFDDADEEAEYNRMLDELANDDNIQVWSFNPKYEDYMREAIGEELYLKLCQRYPGLSKPVRARRMAGDLKMSVPENIVDMLRWLANA